MHRFFEVYFDEQISETYAFLLSNILFKNIKYIGYIRIRLLHIQYVSMHGIRNNSMK